jgi:hypothetical protein
MRHHRKAAAAKKKFKLIFRFFISFFHFRNDAFMTLMIILLQMTLVKRILALLIGNAGVISG